MPAEILFGPLKDKIPLGRTSLNIPNLTSTDVSGKYAFLKIKHRHKHYACRVNRLKMLLEDGDGNVIDFFALGQVADDLKTCERGNNLLCLEFEVEESPGHSNRPYQIIADDTGPKKSLIWVSKPLTSFASASSPEDAENTEIVAQKKTSDTPEKKKGHSYNYQKLSEIKINSVVDVYGVVKFVKPAAIGKGSDYYCVVGLTDPSLLEKEEDKLVCIFFHREPNNLPKVEEGDILRLHRLKIQTYQGGKQGYNGPGFQWVAFHGSVDTRTASSSSYTFEEQDEEQVDHLLDWWSKQGETVILQGGQSIVKNFTPLASVAPKDYFNLLCQVVQVCVLEPDICRLIRVWDGTKCEGQLKVVSEAELNQSLEEDRQLVKASEGLAVDAFLFDNHAKESGHVKPGDFLILTNVHASVVSGFVELTIHGGGQKFSRGVQVLPEDQTEVQNLKAKLDVLVARVAKSPDSCLSEAESEEPTSASRSEPKEKTEGSNIYGDSQGFVLRDNSTDKDETSSDLASGKCSRSRASVVQRHKNNTQEMSKRLGRKDSPSRNKSLRRRMLYNEKNVRGSSTTVFYQNNSASTRSPVRQEEVNDLSFERNMSNSDAANENKQSESSEDSSQSIWLSIYNDSDNDGKNLKRASSSTSLQVHDPSKDNRPSPRPNEGLLSSTKGGCTQRSRDSSNGVSTGRNKSAVQDGCQKTVGEEVETSSQGSFVTAPSPNLQGGAGLLRCGTHQDGAAGDENTFSGSGANHTEEQSQARKRYAEELSSDNDKRIKLSPEMTLGGKRESRRKAKAMLFEQTDASGGEDTTNVNINITTEGQTKDTNRNGLEFDEGLPHAFSQDHLEILDSQMLCFENNDFSQANKTNSGDLDRIETRKSNLHVNEDNEAEKESLRPSRRKTMKEISSLEKSQNLEEHPPKHESRSIKTKETRPSYSIEVLCIGEKSQPSQESCDILQIETGESQVSSSTDSDNLNSLSQPRCMLKTASVVVDHPHVPLSTLQEVLDHPPPHKFRIQAKVERIEPRLSAPLDIVHFLCPRCKFFSRLGSSGGDPQVFDAESMMCPKCVQPPSTLRAVSVLVLQLTDKHNTISASVWDKNADQFFGGITPHQLLTDPNCFREVQQKLNDLCPLGSSMESRPVVECCVCSYYVDGDVKIQIFDTSLV
ncbi:protection of telomeres protein 1 [Elysia marginata]|uniref:Protection of telomeres protein 1 n=1 Tax=Elysia marginata TaxID=1093978 RepID=A0AAV4ICI9_9GAST|nr:protection of telomeres protein 1 [Elysia marginata]